MKGTTSEFGTKRTSGDVRYLVAIRGKRTSRGQPISVAIDPTRTSRHVRCARTLAIKHDKRRSTPIKVPQCGLRRESVRGTTPKAREDQILSKARRNTGTLRTVTEPCRWRGGLGRASRPYHCSVIGVAAGDCQTYTLFGGGRGGLGGIAGFSEGNSLQDRASIGQGARRHVPNAGKNRHIPESVVEIDFWRG
jgi:hypothetical protein